MTKEETEISSIFRKIPSNDQSRAIARDFCEDVLDMAENMRELIEEAHEKRIINIGPGIISLAKVGISTARQMYGDPWVIEAFLENSYPEWDKILKKEKSYFLENSFNLFKKIDTENKYVGELSKVLNSTVCRENDIKTIWSFTFTYVKRTIKFIHYTRKHEPTYYKNIDIEKYSKLFDVTL